MIGTFVFYWYSHGVKYIILKIIISHIDTDVFVNLSYERAPVKKWHTAPKRKVRKKMEERR